MTYDYAPKASITERHENRKDRDSLNILKYNLLKSQNSKRYPSGSKYTFFNSKLSIGILNNGIYQLNVVKSIAKLNIHQVVLI